MREYKTPGVYVEEVSTLPPSVVSVATAIPAFIGYTEMGSGVRRISSLLEYEETFGGPPALTYVVKTVLEGDGEAAVQRFESVTLEDNGMEKFFMHHSVNMYFRNGGGPCYIISVGNYQDGANNPVTPNKSDLENGLALLRKEDEPTLIVIPEAIHLTGTGDYHSIYGAALKQAKNLMDRFVIIDVLDSKPHEDTLTEDVKTFRDGTLELESLKFGAAYYPYLMTTLSPRYTDETLKVETDGDTEAAFDTENRALKSAVQTALSAERVILPPSGAIAGVYARVDRERGVWKAPANVSVSGAIKPMTRLSDDEQENLNVDATSGKSINAIRAFTGKGTLVWGARTLDGNNNEWRYVNVRRLFNLIEESTQKATAFAVFEPNTAVTWLKVRAMIESYLYGLWEAGALAGPTPAASYFVEVGLGKTMTQQDVLEGRMIVEIGIAAARPAEFIILRFSHKIQEA